MTVSAAKMCCQDLRPMSVVNGDGFRQFSQQLINIGATYGQVSVDDVVPKKDAVGKTILKSYEKVESKMTEMFRNYQVFNLLLNLFHKSCKSPMRCTLYRLVEVVKNLRGHKTFSG